MVTQALFEYLSCYAQKLDQSIVTLDPVGGPDSMSLSSIKTFLPTDRSRRPRVRKVRWHACLEIVLETIALDPAPDLVTGFERGLVQVIIDGRDVLLELCLAGGLDDDRVDDLLSSSYLADAGCCWSASGGHRRRGQLASIWLSAETMERSRRSAGMVR